MILKDNTHAAAVILDGNGCHCLHLGTGIFYTLKLVNVNKKSVLTLTSSAPNAPAFTGYSAELLWAELSRQCQLTDIGSKRMVGAWVALMAQGKTP
jgi:hypothetical protein